MFIEKIDGLSCHKIFLVVKVDLEGGTRPKELPLFGRLFVINTIAMLIGTVIKCYVFNLAINVFALRLGPIEMYWRLFLTFLYEWPSLSVPFLTMLVIVKWLEIF